MTDCEAEASADSADEGIQQIPAVISVAEVPAASEARDKLLAAIGSEAQLVAEESAGQASGALAELARAYALVTNGTTPEPQLPQPIDSRKSNIQASPWRREPT